MNGQLVERFVTLDGGSELRFEMDSRQSVILRVVEGAAECFGSELAPQHDYDLQGPTKLAIFSHQGAQLSLKSTQSLPVEYVSNDTAVVKYGELFETCLRNADSRVLIVGEGRNVLARTFVNYGLCLEMLPLLVNLDVRNGAVLFPGILGALPSTPHRPYELTDFRGTLLDASPINPLCYFYGHQDPKDNFKLYGKLVGRLLADCEARCGRWPQPMVIVGPGDGVEEDAIVDLHLHDRLTHIVVIGNERLLSALQRRNLPKCVVLKAPKAAGYVPRDATCRRAEMHRQLEAYFYGAAKELTPYSLTVSFADLHIYRVGEEASVAPSSALPLGAARKVDETRLSKLGQLSSSEVLYAILAVSCATDEAGVAHSPAAGFVHVTHVDEARQVLTLLSPCPGELHSRHLLLGSLKWISS
jgi:polyribonucleotide 5'-hydroxyl-kinase